MTRPVTFGLCADDYAMTPGVSRGILEAIEAGALTATSVMTTSALWPELAMPLRAHEGQVDVGLHLNLTLGAPLGPMPRLAPEDRLPAIGAILKMARSGTLPLAEIGAEIERQCDRFVEIYGRAPDHVDGHQHVHVVAAIRGLVFAALARRGWHPLVRDSGDSPVRILQRRSEPVKALVLTALSSGFATEAGRYGLPVNAGFAGFSRFHPGDDYARQFARYLAHPGPRHLVMCHPGHVDDMLRSLDPVQESRERELAYLLSPAFRAALERRDATLQRPTQLASP